MDNISTYEVNPRILTQGNTGSATRIKLPIVERQAGGYRRPARGRTLQVRVVNTGTYTAATNATIAAAAGTNLIQTVTSNKELIISEPVATQATGTLTLTGVVLDGQTVTIGTRVYQLRTGATALTSGNVAVDISARGTKAQGTLTIAEPVTAGDTIVIGDQTYVFVTGAANAPGEIGIGADEAATKVNIPAAINGTDSINTANTKVTASAFSGDVCTLTARYTGTQGNSIVTAELGQGLTHASNVFNAATLGTTTAGVDVSAAHAILDLVTAITGDASAVVTAADGAGDTLVVTAKTAGLAANSYATTETLVNGSWGAATLTGGADAAAGQCFIDLTNATAETVDLLISPATFGSAPFAGKRISVTHAAP